MSCQIAQRVDWSRPLELTGDVTRAYIGHETCAALLPPLAVARELARALRARGVDITLVTPPLVEPDLPRALRLIEGVAEIADRLEVVCSDWGLLSKVSSEGSARPVIGRLLARRPADPRIERMFASGADDAAVTHLDGTECLLRYRPPTEMMAAALRGCWVDRGEVIALLQGLGVERCELDGTRQGIEVSAVEGWHYSLWVPEVLVSVSRRCPGPGEDFGRPADCASCSAERRTKERVEWRSRDRLLDLFRIANAVYYDSPSPAVPPGTVDRVVRAAS